MNDGLERIRLSSRRLTTTGHNVTQSVVEESHGSDESLSRTPDRIRVKPHETSPFISELDENRAWDLIMTWIQSHVGDPRNSSMRKASVPGL